MKSTLLTVLLIFMTLAVFATEQESDLLIIKNDTILIKSFPLEVLNLKYRPFNYSLRRGPSTACMRGYVAIWRILENELYLEKIVSCNSDNNNKKQNIIELFNLNKLDYKKKNEMILADWFSAKFYNYFYPKEYYNNKFCLVEEKNERDIDNDVDLKLLIVKGELKLNRIN